MKVSNKGLVELASHEGLVLKPYLDSVGVWTIGVGHTSGAGEPKPQDMPKDKEISIHEAMEIFRKDIKKFEDRVNKAVKVPLKQHQFDALVSFDYNTGGIYKAKLTQSLNSGDYDKAGDQFMGWVKPPEIRGRREKEQALFRSGRYGNGKVTLYDTNNAGKVLWSSGKSVDILSYLSSTQAPEFAKKPLSEPENGSKEGFDWVGMIIKVIKAILKGTSKGSSGGK